MALVLKDRVKETTTSTGTGTINLAGAATGFEGFVSAVGDGNTCYYAILDANGSAWEVGIGTVTDASPDTLSRTTILESSNSDNAITLTSGTHTVFLTYPADKSVYRNSNDQIVATASGIVFSDSTVQTTAPVDTNTTYTAGSGLQLDSTTFNAKTATTSASGITTLTNTIDSTQTKALTPKAVDDAGYGTMSNFILEDGDGTEVTIANGKEVKFVEGNGIDIDWTDVSDGSDSDPYDLTFTVDHDAASNFVANEHIDHTSVTLTAGSGLSGGGDISSNRTFNALTATTSASGITILTNTIDSTQTKALTPKAVNDAGYLTAHPNISAASSSNNSSRTYIQDLLLDSNGHVTGVATAAETVTDTNTTYTAGTGITLNGTEFDIDPTLISGRTEVTSADADYLLVWDADDSKLKKVDAGEFRGGGGGSARSVAGDTDNGVITWVTSDDTFAVESGLTYTGGTLTATGIIDVTNTLDASDATGDTGAIRTEGGVSIAKKLYVGTDLDVDGTTNLDAVDIDGNVQLDGTLTVGVNDTGKDVKFYGATAGSYFEWDESEDRLNLVGGAYVNEAVPANDTPTAEDATVTLDLSLGNYHNISLGNNVTKFEFTNAKRGQRFILRITQNASSAKTVAWTNVDSDTGGTAATVRWAGNITPTMSTSTSHTDVYGFLCTNNAGTNFDGFIIGQDIPD